MWGGPWIWAHQCEDFIGWELLCCPITAKWKQSENDDSHGPENFPWSRHRTCCSESGSHSMSWCWVCWGFCVQFVSSSEQKRWIRWFWWREQTGNGCIYCFMVSGIWSVMDPWDKRPFLIFCNEILWIFSEYLAIVYLFYTKVLLFSINLLFKRSLTQVAAWFHDLMISWFQHVIYSKCMWKNKVI